MPSLSLLDVAIGMVFLYLLLSLICSALNESLAALLQARAHFLERGIIRMVGDIGFKEKLYNHALIRNLYDGNVEFMKNFRGGLPSYIPSKNFAIAVMDLLQPGTGARNAMAAPGWSSTPDQGLLAALDDPHNAIPEHMKTAITTLVHAAGQDATRIRQNIEDWFDSTMERVSGAYKRRTHYVLFALGLLSAIAINADSVTIAKRLATTQTLTDAVTKSAQAFVTAQNASSPTDPKAALANTLSVLDRLNLPIGWDGPDHSNLRPPMQFSSFGAWLSLLGMHWAGWLLTALAISFGAPFWFDVLSRFMVVRSTIKPDDKQAN